MQQRRPKSQTSYRPLTTPISINFAPSDVAAEKTPSRLGQRSLGINNRIWLILILIVSILGLSHWLWPGSPVAPYLHTPFSTLDLKAINYFNTTEHMVNPFKFCPIYGPGDDVGRKYDREVLTKSVMHQGTGTRLQRVLTRAMNGNPITISVLGSSVSACHGAGDDPISRKCYPSKFFEWWNTVFPNPATELTNGAMRRTNSGYFGFCSAHHLPDFTDLVIIELDTEDTPDDTTRDNFETLIRSILLRPDSPAILLLGHFSPQIYTAWGFAGPDQSHNIVAQFYDIPHVTIRPALLPEYLKNPDSIQEYYIDPILSSEAGHNLMADMLVAYMQDQICTTWNNVVAQLSSGADGVFGAGGGPLAGLGQRKGVPGALEDHELVDADGIGNEGGAAGAEAKADADAANANANANPNAPTRVPPTRMNARPNTRPYEEIAPYCVSANDLINPLPPSLFYGSGWHAFHPASTHASPDNAYRTTAHYWYSTLPTSKLRIPIQVGAGDVGVYVLREPRKDVGEGSAAECWVDDNYAGAKVLENVLGEGEGEEPVASLRIIDKWVSRGSHFVECQLVGEEGKGTVPFKIIGIFST